MKYFLMNFRATCSSVEMLKGYTLIFRNAEMVHGQRKVGNPCLTAFKSLAIVPYSFGLFLAAVVGQDMGALSPPVVTQKGC